MRQQIIGLGYPIYGSDAPENHERFHPQPA